MPFYPSPDRDDGYDITDFYGVDPRLGTLGDFVEFVRTARDRGMRVIADLVVNHTSDQHPWFVEARSSRDSPKRDWYIWRDEEPADAAAGRRVPRPGDQRLGATTRRPASTTCTSSTSTSPTSTSRTPRSATRSRGSWASGSQLGLSGFRVDAVPFLHRDQAPAGQARPARPARLPRRPVGVPAPAQRRGGAARRGQPALPGPDAVLRRPRRRRQHGRADHVLRLHRHAGDVPVAGPRRRRAAGRRAASSGRSRPRTGTGPPSCATTTS